MPQVIVIEALMSTIGAVLIAIIFYEIFSPYMLVPRTQFCK